MGFGDPLECINMLACISCKFAAHDIHTHLVSMTGFCYAFHLTQFIHMQRFMSINKMVGGLYYIIGKVSLPCLAAQYLQTLHGGWLQQMAKIALFIHHSFCMTFLH